MTRGHSRGGAAATGLARGRALLALGALLAVLFLPFRSQAETDPVRHWRFAAYLDDSPIGFHEFSISRGKDGALEVISRAEFRVKILILEAYHYLHEAHEVWLGGCLGRLEARTDDNGEQSALAGEAAAGAFRLRAGTESRRIDGCVHSFAYWDRKLLEAGRLLNAQTGAYEPVELQPLGSETIRVRGVPTTAQRVALKLPRSRIDLWYSPQGEWLGLETATDSGRRIQYRLD
jgi:hypothetical protein